MAQVEIDYSDLPPIAAWGPPRDYAPTPGEDAYERPWSPRKKFAFGVGAAISAWAMLAAIVALSAGVVELILQALFG
jgi:hypothetical protein